MTQELRVQFVGVVTLLGAITLLACGSRTPDAMEVEPAILGEVCGQPSPFRLLELEPYVHLTDSPLRGGDRLFFVTRQEGLLKTGGTEDLVVWATGPCGEAPVIAATGVSRVFEHHRLPDVVLGCAPETGDIVALDPWGVDEPNLVFSGVGCSPKWTDHGVVAVHAHADGLGALVLHAYPADPSHETAAPQVLVDPVRTHPLPDNPYVGERDVLAVPLLGEDVFALTPDMTLIRVSLAELSISIEQENVRIFDVSTDGAYLLWQDMISSMGEPEFPEGDVIFRDRDSGIDTPLLETSLAYGHSPLRWTHSAGVVAVRLGTTTVDPERFYVLPALDFIELPGDVVVGGPLVDGRWYVFSRGGGPSYTADLETGSLSQFTDRLGFSRWRPDTDGVEILEGHSGADDRYEGRLWFAPFNKEAGETLLAERATAHWSRLEDGQVITPRRVGGDSLADLVLIDPDALTESLIDTRVSGASVRDLTRALGEQTIAYSVSDDDRSGVWVARILPSGSF